MSKLVDKGLKAKHESKYIDFKRSFNPTSPGEWCELIKDIVAMANSGGGAIFVGLNNGGSPSGEDVQPVLNIDQAIIIDKIRKYTGYDFSEIAVHEAEKGGQTIAVLEVSAVRIPLVFQNVGTYEVPPGKQKTAFSKGTIYFRHGAKSEPGTTEDIRGVIERQLKAIRSEWLDGVRKVIKAPQGSAVTVFRGKFRESSSLDATPVRLVDDPAAPGYRLIDHDITHPYRQTELLEVVNGMLPDGVAVNAYDLLAARRTHDLADDPMYSHIPKFGGQQYSDDFAKWLVQMHKENNNFFVQAREAFRKKKDNSA